MNKIGTDNNLNQSTESIAAVRGNDATAHKFGNFRVNFILANSVKRHICDVQNSRPKHDLHISVNDRVISPYCESFILTKLRICKVSQK